MAAGNDGWILRWGCNEPPNPLFIRGNIEQAWQTWWWWQTFWSEDYIPQRTFLLTSPPCTSRSFPFNPVGGHIFFSHCLHGVNWIKSLRTGTTSITAIFYDSASSLLYWKDLCERSFWITVTKHLTEKLKGFIWTHGFRGLSSWELGILGSSLYDRTEAEGGSSRKGPNKAELPRTHPQWPPFPPGSTFRFHYFLVGLL